MLRTVAPNVPVQGNSLCRSHRNNAPDNLVQPNLRILSFELSGEVGGLRSRPWSRPSKSTTCPIRTILLWRSTEYNQSDSDKAENVFDAQQGRMAGIPIGHMLQDTKKLIFSAALDL